MKFTLAAYASDYNNVHIPLLQASAKKWGWEPVKLFGGPGTWHGHGPMAKVRCLKDFIPKMRAEGYTHLIFTDSYDSVVCNSPDAIMPFLNDGALNAAEMACYPHPELSVYYPEGKSRWRHLNGGGLVSNIDFLELFIMPGCDDPIMDDQCYMRDKYLSQNPLTNPRRDPWLELDTGCEVFQCTAHCGEPTQFFEKEPDGRILNKETGTHPIFFHFNGRSDGTWFCDGWKPWWEHC